MRFIAFDLPIVLLLAVVYLHWRRGKQRGKHWLTWIPLICTAIAVWRGIWGQIIIHRLAARSPFDFEYEARSIVYVVPALLAAIVWLAFARSWPATVNLIVVLYLLSAWLLACASL